MSVKDGVWAVNFSDYEFVQRNYLLAPPTKLCTYPVAYCTTYWESGVMGGGGAVGREGPQGGGVREGVAPWVVVMVVLLE